MNTIAAMLGHVDLLPIIYGLAIFFGLAIMIFKLKRGMWISLLIDIAVFWFVFKLHSGSMSGAFAATIAALLAGLFFPMLLRRRT